MKPLIILVGIVLAIVLLAAMAKGRHGPGSDELESLAEELPGDLSV